MNSPRKEFRVEAKASGQESGSSSLFSLVLVSGKIQNPQCWVFVSCGGFKSNQLVSKTNKMPAIMFC